MDTEPPMASGRAAPETRAARRAIFARHAVLGLLEPQEIDRVLAFSVARQFRPGEVIFRKGDAGDSMMVVFAGRVKIGVVGPDSREAVLAILGVGEILGEMAILDSKPRSADAIALEATELLVLHRRDFIPFLEHNPRIATRLLRLVCERLRRTSALVEDRMFRQLPARLAKALLELASDGPVCPPGIRIELHMSQKTFASVLGVSREALNKQLRAWEDAGLVGVGRGHVTIEQPDALARIVDA